MNEAWRSRPRRMALKMPYPQGEHREFDSHRLDSLVKDGGKSLTPQKSGKKLVAQ